MSIVSQIKAFYYSTKTGWHHGKGGKCLKCLDYQSALKHYHLAYKYAQCSENEGTVAVELECIARTYYRLNDFALAKQHAEKSLAIYSKYQTNDKSGLFSEGVSRVQELILRIQT